MTKEVEKKSIEEELNFLSNIDIWLNWIVQEFKFSKMTLTKDLSHELILNLEWDFDSVDMSYECVFILNPSNSNIALKWVVNEFNSPQKTFDDWQMYLDRANKIHYEYKKDSEMVWTIKFLATVSKYEIKNTSNQIKLYIPKNVAEFILNHVDHINRLAIVFLDKNN